jgi:hypothetical protein
VDGEKDMRETLYNYLLFNSSISSWHPPFSASATTKKLYGVIIIGEVMRSPVNRKGAWNDLQIWLYFEKGDFLSLDEAADEIKGLLTDVLLTTGEGRRFHVEYVGMRRDFYDDELRAIAKRIDFTIPCIV